MSVLVLMAACSGGEEAKLPGAVREHIPVFQPSVVAGFDTRVFSTGEDFDTIENHEAITWRLSTARPLADVIAFYERIAVPRDEGSESPAAESGEPDANGDEAKGDESDGGQAGARSALPRRVFPLPSQPGSEVEVAVYLQPRERRVWFDITETTPGKN